MVAPANFDWVMHLIDYKPWEYICSRGKVSFEVSLRILLMQSLKLAETRILSILGRSFPRLYGLCDMAPMDFIQPVLHLCLQNLDVSMDMCIQMYLNIFSNLGDLLDFSGDDSYYCAIVAFCSLVVA
jgi:hypothetical protein